MNTLWDFFQNENTSYNSFTFYDKFDGTVVADKEPFEFHLRVTLNLSSNSTMLFFYIKETSHLVDLIENILTNIDIYKTKANSVKGTPTNHSTIPLGERSTTFSSLYYFYTENQPTESELNQLKRFCLDKPFSIEIRSQDYVEHQIDKQTIYCFVSHDWNDKEMIARPIANGLISRLCTVWYDEYSLEIGDNLLQSIEKGIKEAKKCILVITKNFLSNFGWAKKEFETIIAREMVKKEKIIIPVWYDVSPTDVYEYSPSLALIIAVIWPSKENKPEEQYENEVQRAIDKLSNILKKSA